VTRCSDPPLCVYVCVVLHLLGYVLAQSRCLLTTASTAHSLAGGGGVGDSAGLAREKLRFMHADLFSFDASLPAPHCHTERTLQPSIGGLLHTLLIDWCIPLTLMPHFRCSGLGGLRHALLIGWCTRLTLMPHSRCSGIVLRLHCDLPTSTASLIFFAVRFLSFIGTHWVSTPLAFLRSTVEYTHSLVVWSPAQLTVRTCCPLLAK
jgi:hypothetical protein